MKAFHSSIFTIVIISVLQLKSKYQKFFTSAPPTWQSTLSLEEYTSMMALLEPTTALPLGEAEQQQSLCSPQQIARGKWMPRFLTKSPYNSTHTPSTCSSYGAYEGQNNFNGTHLQSYQWVLDDQETCNFPMAVWNQTKACNLLTNQKILIMGDSLSLEHHLSLALMMGMGDKEGKHKSDQETCQGTARVAWRRSDNLNETYVQLELDKTPDYVILNFGAHYVEDDAFLEVINRTVHQVQQWQNRCKDLNKTSCQLIWRTTVPGHARCMNGCTSPNNNLTAMEEWVATGRMPPRFSWDRFKHQNSLAVAALEESGVDFAILDAYSINILRPDGHRLGEKNDCLHSCLGSKIDVYTQALFHLIELHKATALIPRTSIH